MIRTIILALGLLCSLAQAQTVISPPTTNLTCSSLLDAGAFCNSSNASNLSGTVASGRLSGAYSGITGLGTLASGAVPTTLLTGVLPAAQLSGATLTGTITTSTTVNALPTCNTAARGTSYVVTDALLPAALVIVSTGGAVVVRVLCNGTAWIVG